MHQCIYNSSDGNALALGITVVTEKNHFAEVNIEDIYLICKRAHLHILVN